jgi:hypothetical protein
VDTVLARARAYLAPQDEVKKILPKIKIKKYRLTKAFVVSIFKRVEGSN